MSQKNQSDGGQKGFAVGRGLLAAAETLNFSMSDQRSSQQMGGMVSGMGMGGGGDIEGQDGTQQMSQRGSGSHIGNTMKLFTSLGLSPSDLDALAQIPEENISVETLPHILMQLKSHKAEAGERRMSAGSLSSEAAFRGGREDWDGVHMGRMGGSSMGQGSARSQSNSDFGYGSMQDISPGRGYNLNYGNSSGGGGRERQYSELSRPESYGGLGMGSSSSESVFMPRRVGFPSQGKVKDFLGVVPSMFPHVCSLCDFDVHSIMEWNQHTNGLRHAENRRQLLQMYPDWDPGMAPNRGGGLMGGPNLSAGLLGPVPMSSGQTAGGMTSNWGGCGGAALMGKNQHGQPKLRSRVVVAKYAWKPLSNKSLFSLAEPFGHLREKLVLKNKAFLEMETHQEAVDMVNFYQQHPASIYGKPVTFYLSEELLVIEKDERPADRLGREVKGQDSQVVFFSNLPREEEKKKELLTIAGRFGIVQKHLFLTDQAFVQLETPNDAQMLVKYYTLNPLTIKGRQIRLNICTKYKTLNVNRGAGGSDSRGRRSAGATASTGNKFSKSSSSKSSSKSREDKKKEENKAKKAEAEEEEVAGVMEADDGEEEDEGQDTTEETEEQEEEQTAEAAEETLQESENKDSAGDDITPDPHQDGGVETAEKGAESKEPDGPRETETSTEGNEAKEEASGETGESQEVEEDQDQDSEDQDFPENMEDFVTLDELGEEEHEESDAIDPTRRGGMRVVNVLGFRRGYGFVRELLDLAKPFGEVVKHLVLDLRAEAYLQFATEEEARGMAKFYNGNVTATVCGRPVRVSHSMTYPTIQCGSSKVVYIGQLPTSKYSDEAVLTLAEPYGKVRKYFLNRIKRECFVEMEQAEDAEKMAEEYKATPPKINGKRLSVYVSRKYKQLKYGHRRPNVPEEKKPTKREISTVAKSSKQPEEPPVKKAKEEKPAAEEKEEQAEGEEQKTEEVQEEKMEEKMETSGAEQMSENSVENETTEATPEDSDLNLNTCSQEPVEEPAAQSVQIEATPPPAEAKPTAASLPLLPYDPESPVGVEHVKKGFYCRVCFLFYSNEDAAKKKHCSSQAHYNKLQMHLEKEQMKAEKKKKEINTQ
ncbi:matrin 3-like 1.2 [Genypterus blacodes]|uniref:matrin 3-like 1.2 n=1 Tax=Genypterus blacodes TaxID=154954 RepID=UPI003F77483E